MLLSLTSVVLRLLRGRRFALPRYKRLPLELWISILEYAEDDELVVAAAACCAFNEHCSEILLLRNNISRDSLRKGTLSITPSLLPGLQRAFFIPAIQQLSCAFTGPHVLRDLKVLRNILSRAPGATNLDLSFPDAPRPVDDDGNLVGEDARTAIAVVIRDILYHSVRRGDKPRGPVYFVGSGLYNNGIAEVFVARRGKGGAASGSLSHMSTLLYTKSGSRSQLREWIDGLPIQTVWSLKVVPLALSRGNGLGRMILLNNDKINHMDFLSDTPASSAPPTANTLSTILPQITLPSLAELCIKTSGIDPAILSDFLSRHNTLKALYYEPEQEYIPPVLVTPTVNLPHLELLSSASKSSVESTAQRNLAALPLIDGVTFSPICNIGMRYGRETSAVVAAWKALLHRVAELEMETRLTIAFTHDVTIPNLDPVPVDDEERNIAKTLTEVKHVEVELLQLSDMGRILPWLAILPALTHVTFWEPKHTLYVNQVFESPGFQQQVVANLKPNFPAVRVEFKMLSVPNDM
ncbi:hypothetical protein C8R43DRAFT_1016852 [Mycena crocata]|nr:hypothetical protein C8R43DRAFT_1016852 [Mycena crocata]